MNKECKQEDLDKFSEMYRDFKERCKRVVKIINEIYGEITGKHEPFCFEDFYIDEQSVFFNVCYAGGPLRKIIRSFPCCLLTMNEDSELKREILKLMIVEHVEEDELSVDELVEIIKNIKKTKTMKGLDSTVTKEMLDKFHDCCTDGRFEMIERVKTKLIEATNIETADDEMKVIDNILFRFWQMGWLDMIDEKINNK